MSFLKVLKRIINSGQSRSIILTGNLYDLFFDGKNYVPLIDFLSAQLQAEPASGSRGITQLIYELNSPIEARGNHAHELDQVWSHIHPGKPLSERFRESNWNATFALELLRQLTVCNRRSRDSRNNLLILIEASDLLIPDSEVGHMSLQDRRRVAIIQDWFSDPAFMNGGDTVVLLAESRSNLHHRIARLPQMLSVEVPLPDLDARKHFIEWWVGNHRRQVPNLTEIVSQTAGLSMHAIRQLLLSDDLSARNITRKVEEYMISQLGEGVVEFQRPSHTLDDVVGFRRVKEFMREELIPGFRGSKDEALSGAAVGGPIGGGKTFICEAVAAELGIPVITLKNIRSKWFGETDKIFERLRRLLETFHKIVIFVDEADAQFGDIEGGHETERRLTGKIQAMMSDTRLRGRVIWFLMTARIHRLSPDIRRPGRMDLILPILDPEGEDRQAFIRWTFAGLQGLDEMSSFPGLEAATKGYSAASFAALRSRIKAKRCATLDQALHLAQDMIPPDIEATRRYQTLQAMLNCTRKSLLFDPDTDVDIENQRRQWKEEIARLEREGLV